MPNLKRVAYLVSRMRYLQARDRYASKKDIFSYVLKNSVER